MAFINKIVDTSGKLIELKEFLSSSKGRDILLYLVFVIISFAFWAILSLNNLIQDNYKVRFRITGIPQGVTMINDYPREFNVTVKNNGYVLLKYMIGDNPEITVDFKELRELRLKMTQMIKTKVTKGTNSLVLILLPNVKRTCTLITTFCIDWFTNKIGRNIFKLRAKSKFLVYTGSDLQ